MGINDRLNARRTEQAGGTSFAAGGINARLTGSREREQAAAQRETMFSRTPSFAVTSQNRNGAFGGGTDFLAPMREEINLASALSQAERQLAAEKAKPGIRAASKSSYTLPGEIDYDNIRDGAKIADLTDEVSRLQSALHRNIYEGAADGKTVPDGITQRQGSIGSAVPSVDAGFARTIPIEHMTEDERRTYDYLYEKSPSMASKYGASIRAQVNERAAESLGREIEDVSRRNPVVGVGMNLIGSMASPAAALDALGSRLTGQPYDPNSPTSYPVLMTQASQEGLTGGIENSFVKFLADTGLSTAQFLSKIPLGGWALPVMASGAAGQTAYDARKSGASTDEALKLGVIAGAAEAVLEKVPLDDVLKSFKGAASTIGAKLQLGKVFKPWLSSILGTSLEEGGEELVTEYINNIADLAIRGDEGRLAQYKQELVESGMSEQEAERKARLKYWVTDPLLSFAGGALSGGAMAGVGQVSGAAGRKIQSAVENRQAKKQAEADAAAKAQQETAAAGADTTAQEIFDDPEAEAAELDDVLEAEEAEQAREWAAEDRAEEERTAAQGTREGTVEDENLVRARTVLDDGVLPTAVTEERQRRAQTAKTDTERSGILAGASDADITLAQTISRAFGRKVIFASDDMRYNGKAKNGVITVNLKSGGVASQTLAHELMHTLEPYRAQYGSIVKVLRDMVSQRAGSMYIDPSDSTKNRRWETWEELRQKVYAQGYEKVYAEEGRRFTEADADYEVAANLIAEMFENSQTLEEFVRANRNIAVRIWTKVKTFARRAKALVTRERAVGSAGDALRLAGYYDQIASMLADSLRRTKYRTRQMSAKAAKAGGEKFSFAGVGRDGIREYISDFPPDMPLNERKKIFKKRIFDVFKFGQVYLQTDTKKLLVETDPFTVEKNLFGDENSTRKGYQAKIASLGDLVDILERSKFDGKKVEPSYDPVTNQPRKNVEPKNAAHKGVKYWYYYTNTVRIDGVNYSIVFNIRDKGKEQFVYLIEVKEKTALESHHTRKANSYSLRSSSIQVPHNTIITDSGGNVNTTGEKYSLPEMNEQENRRIADKAIAHFGRTYLWKEAGYLLPDGKRLDFSGRHEGASGGERTVDHRDIEAIYPEGTDGVSAMIDFMSRGAIRISPESGGINLSVRPTRYQESLLENFITTNHGEVYLDIDSTDGRTAASVEYPRGTKASKVIQDIRNWFDEGVKPYVSELQQFRYSLPDTDTSTEPPKAPKPKKMSWSDMVAEVAKLVAPKSYTAYQKRILRDNILALYDRLNTVESPEDYERIKAETEAAAMDMAEELTAANRQEIPGRTEVRDDIKAALRQPIKVSEEAKRDFHGRYGDFFRANMGRLGLRNAGRGIDSVYGELSEQYPEWFPADIETEGDQLRQFAKVWEIVDREDFVSESIYDVTGGEELMQADQKRIARTILDSYSQLLGIERSEMQRRQDELAAAKRRNRSEYDEKLAAQEAQYAAQAEESAAVYATELAKARDEGRAAVEAERVKWMEKDAKRRKAEADRKQAAEDKRRRRGGKIALGKVAEALKNGTFTQAMQKLYDELHEWEAELGRFAGQNPVDIEDAAYYDELVEKIDDRKAYINRVGQAKNKALRDSASKFLEDAKIEEWKDKAAGLFYSISTMQRNIEQISGHSESGERMIEEYFAPISRHNADAVRLKNDVRSRVRALNLSTKKTGQNKLSESAFVQLVGEARDNIYMLEHHMGYTTYYDKAERRAGRTLEEWRNVLDTLMAENPDMDMDKINKAIKEFTAIYDQLIESINAVRLNNGYAPISYRHGYFPHYTNDTPDGLFASLLKGLGFQVDMDGVPTSINGLTSQFRPGKQYEGYEKQRSENVGEFYNGIRLDGMGAVEGIDRYVEVAANVIFLTGDIQKLRALSDSIRFVTSKEEIKNRVKEIRKDENIPEEEKQSMIDRIYDEGEYALRNFVVELDEYTNLLAGKKSFNDRNAERFLGRGLYDFGKKMEQRIAANMVAFNPGSWISNFIPLVQSGAVLSKGDLIRGMQETLAAGKEDDGFIARSTFLTNRIGSERMVKTAATLSSKLDKFNYKLGELQDWLPDGMGAIDMFTAQTIVRARYNENIGKGMSQETAMQEADDFAARLMGDRSKGAMPTIFSQQNPVMKLFTQYQLEVANQLFWMKNDLRFRYSDNSKKKLAAALLRFFIGAAIYNFFYKSMTGRDAATDPIGMLNDFVGDVSGWCLPDLTDIPNSIREEGFTAEAVKAMFKTDRQGVIAGIGNLATNLVEEVPFVGGLIGGGRLPVSSAIPNPANILGGVGSLVKGSGKQGAAALYKELSKPLYYVAAPFGGGQVKKTLEGAAAIAQGGSFGYDKDGKAQLQYPMYRDNPADAITGAARTLLFGKTSTAQAQDWIDSGFKTLSGKRTEAYRNAIAAGASQREAFDAVNAIKGEKLNEKLAALAAAEVSEDVKASLYYDLLASDKERETIDKIGNTGAVYNVLVKLKGLDGNTRGKVEAISESGLGAAQKEEIFERHVTDTYKEKLDAVKADGLTIDDFFTAYRYKLSAKGTQAKAEVLKKIDAMNLTSEQKDALYRCFYQEASLQNAPWHRMFPALELPEISFPNIEIPKIEFNPGF